MITVIDYGMGNLRSVAKALEHVGASARVTSDPREVAKAEKLILPGVGAFGAAMQELAHRRLVEPIRAALRQGRPYLGICLGLQLLFQDSEEDPGVKGLGVLQGTVRRFPGTAGSMTLKVPHMGWNQVSQNAKGKRQHLEGCPVLGDIPDGSYFYFVHSYYADPADRSLVLLEADYGIRFTAMVWKDRLFATQFHPEKSQALGLRLLKNFVEL
ncbi:MAG: imidazole glycerol phosphate synthase subunit HisH [Candidatus Omnitrophica bacterium]|nr:imidazole glycerol phosphate synthase subunit HisH [Candidatus Omnitrophota bacterium]